MTAVFERIAHDHSRHSEKTKERKSIHPAMLSQGMAIACPALLVVSPRRIVTRSPSGTSIKSYVSRHCYLFRYRTHEREGTERWHPA